MTFIAASAQVDDTARVGQGTKVWDLAQVRTAAVIGEESIIGRSAYVDAGVTLGRRCKVQNLALLYAPAVIGDGVFIGPGVVLTNDTYPRAVNSDGSLKSSADWDMSGVVIEDGAAIGARAVCVAPVTIGRWATVAAGSVVTRDVPAFGLVVGVPARQVGWVGKSGRPLIEVDGGWLDPATEERYELHDGALTEAEA